ncbi:chromate efflux transporter [Kitasatospora sp. CB01950]|uniref:chromate efflux transporter n=1 Tax=Kitasatospora sp. CB01950 TaxID=1703930 RepID=UPI00093DFE12|nr:chromate efflux transporter [Kitasatospora sp. CB01950]OKJ15680.1 chromate transporter [Kitasatospora sp. CB01950]
MAEQVPLRVIAKEWGRIGVLGFGGPPAHILLLRRLCVEQRGWLAASEFEDGIAATNLLPGPASTQLAIFTAWRVRGTAGALVGGAAFIVPGLVLILLLAALFLAGDPPRWVLGAAAGAGAAVAAVAVQAAGALVPASLQRSGGGAARVRWVCYLLLGAAAAILTGPWLVLVLLATGAAEIAFRRPARRTSRTGDTAPPRPEGDAPRAALPLLVPGLAATGGLGALAWVALKVGALSYGGGFVIIPLMQQDAVHRYHWMTDGQFLNAVALGQITPGPVVQTVAVVGYAAAGVLGGLFAAAVAFGPSFLLVLLGAAHFDRLRANTAVQDFLTGAGPAVIGAIAGSALPLALALHQPWQYAILGLAALWLLVLRRGVVPCLLAAGALGTVAALCELALP